MTPWSRRSRRHQTFAQWFDANVTWLLLGLTTIAVGTVAVYAMNSAGAATSTTFATGSPSVQADAGPLQVAVIGDFYTACPDSISCSDENVTGALATQLGWNPHFFTEPGSGYVTTEDGTSTYGDRVEAVIASAPEIVIVQGGRNDRFQLDELPSAAANVLTRLQAGLPNSEIVVIGPSAQEAAFGPSTANIAAGSAASAVLAAQLAESARILSEAVETSGADLFVDPLAEGWFLDMDPAALSTDGLNASPEGLVYLVDRLVPHLQALGR